MKQYESSTIPAVIAKGIEKHDKEVFIATKRNGEWVKMGKEEFCQKVRYFALGLYELGISKGDCVSLHAENSAEWVICDQAILSLGAVNVPIYPSQPADQIEYIIKNSETKMHIVSTDELFADTKPLMKEMDHVQGGISLFGSSHKELRSFADVVEKGKQIDEKETGKFDQLKAEVSPDDLATLIYTSGTTDHPKGVELTHNNIASNALASLERVPFDEEVHEDQRMLSYLPLSHVFERLITYIYLTLGYPVYYTEKVDEIREDFHEVKPFFFATVPRLLEKVHTGITAQSRHMSGFKKWVYEWAVNRTGNYDPEHPPSGVAAFLHDLADRWVYSEIRELFGGKLLGFINGGAALAPELFRFYNGIGLYGGQGYGLTETSPVISTTDVDHMRVGSAGRLLSNVEVKIADDGEILTKGPNVMNRYYHDKKKTDEVFTSDGWLKTGDVGKLEDGYLFVTDRKKSVFKLSTGKYVAPQTIENRLINSGYIEQVVVVGFKRKFCSALIVPNYEHVAQQLDMEAHSKEKILGDNGKVRKLIQREVDEVNAKLSPWETVKKFVLLDEPFTIESGEMTPTHKIKRTVVTERYKEEIDSMYEDE